MKQIHNKALLVVALLVAVLISTVLALFPFWERYKEQQQQKAMILRIEEGAEIKKEPEQTQSSETMEPPSKDSIPQEKETASDKKVESEIPVGETVRVPEEGAEIGILEIPRIDAKLPVTAGVSEGQLKISEGWVRQTDMVGSEGNAVIAGHRSYTFGVHFNRLDELKAGDEIFFMAADGESMRFIVEETLIVAPDDPAVFALPPEGMAQLTLYTCTPIREATHRLVVRALLLEE